MVVVPCFNEERRLDSAEFARFAADDRDTGFLFVDDGSTDGTGALLRDAEGRNPDAFQVMALGRNQGKAEAVRLGLLRAVASGARVVGYWDADLASPLDELEAMIDLLEGDTGLDGVLASRVMLLGRTIERRPLRHYLGRVFATAASLLLRLPVYDTQCGAKVFRVTDALANALHSPFRTRWIFDVELLSRLGRTWGPDTARRLAEHPVHRWSDVEGSKLRMGAMLVAALDLARIWADRRR